LTRAERGAVAYRVRRCQKFQALLASNRYVGATSG
jgi:hypothetical protein